MVADALEKAGGGAKGVGLRIEYPGKDAAAAYDQEANAIVVPTKDWAKSDTFKRHRAWCVRAG